MILGRGTAQTDGAILAEYAQLLEQSNHRPTSLKRLQEMPGVMCRRIGKPILQWSDEDILTLYFGYQQGTRLMCNVFLAFLFFRGYHRPSIPLLGILPLKLGEQWPNLLEPSRKKFGETYQGYGKDYFLEQPYEPFNPLKHFLRYIYAIVYGKSFICRVDFLFFGLAFAFFWASEATKPADFFKLAQTKRRVCCWRPVIDASRR